MTIKFLWQSILFILVFCTSSLAQEYLIQNGKNTNRIDANGNRQGEWIIPDKMNNLEFKTSFKDDVMNDTILFFQNKLLEFIWINLKNDSVKYLCNVNEKFCEGYFTKENLEYCIDDSLVQKKVDFFAGYQYFPTYNGGEQELEKYMKKNVSPLNNYLDGQQVIVKVNFIVNYKGLITDVKIKVASGSLPKNNNDLILVFKNMDRWLPGFNNGKFNDINFIYPLVLYK